MPSCFRAEFAAARAAGLHSVPHAGESVGTEEIWSAVDDLGAERIGHGVAAAGDQRLLDRLREDHITLEVCPSSNVATGVVRALEEHPLPLLLAAGVPVVLGSDDPPMFGTSLLEEYRRVRDRLGLPASTLRALAAASIPGEFCSARPQGRTECPRGSNRIFRDIRRGTGDQRRPVPTSPRTGDLGPCRPEREPLSLEV